MAKTNDQTGATAVGASGIVEHGAPIADGRTLSELDPERNLDGSPIDGDAPAEAEEEVPSSPGNSSPASAEKTASTSRKSAARR